MSYKSREIQLVGRPKGEPGPECFALVEKDLPNLQSGQVLVRNQFISVDPYMRGRMNDAKSYVPPFQLNEAMTGGAVGTVIRSAEPAMPEGTNVLSMYGWREAYVSPVNGLQVVDGTKAPLSAYLGVLGVTGMTAWVGLFRVASLKDGEPVFVSGGAGAVGSIVCQLARMHGCKVLASAGSAEKVRFLTDHLKVDHAFSYRDGEPLDHLKAGAPNGIDVYFDNTGGPQLEAALWHIRNFGRMALCGAIAGYNTPVPGPRNLAIAIGKRLTLRGFIVSDHFSEMPSFLAEAVPALQKGKLLNQETVVAGLENAPNAFLSLLQPGDSHIGKLVIDVS